MDNNCIVFAGIPLPPTSNHSYTPIRIRNYTRLVPSADLKKFKAAFKRWAFLNQKAVGDARETCKSWVYLDVSVYICMQFYTKIGDPKKIDGSNRVKSVHDCLAEVLGKDDSLFWNSSVSKVHCKPEEEQTVVVVKPAIPSEYESISKLKMLI